MNVNTLNENTLFIEERPFTKSKINLEVKMKEEEIKHSDSIKLNLSNRKLEVIPEDLFNSKQLEVLYLSNNYLKHLPANFKKLENLKVLYLDKNQFQNFPQVLLELKKLEVVYLNDNEIWKIEGSFKNLKRLRIMDLSGNQLRIFPKSFFSLKSIEVLSICKNRLEIIPDKIGNLSTLRRLNLDSNLLVGFPLEIQRLKVLEKLNIDNNRLEQIPKGLLGLNKLEVLSLKNNQIKSLPSRISALTYLRSLELSDNKIQKLPSSIRELKQLRLLNLGNNQLKELPQEVCFLETLETLVLNDNQIHSIAKEISSLKQLNILHLNNNQLTKIPESFADLPLIKKYNSEFNNFMGLRLTGNKFKVPPELFDRSPYEQIRYLISLQNQGSAQLNEAKMILLGNPEAGKTALIERIVSDTYTGNTEMTKGINIQPWDLDDVKINIWDFGGQEIMHAMHQFFMTERTLYLLLVDSRKDQNHEDLEIWLELIRTYGGKSPVILIVSKIDVRDIIIDENKLRDKYQDNIHEIIKTSAKTAEGISELKSEIRAALSKLKHVKDEFPKNHLTLKASIQENQITRNYIDLNEYYSLCIKNFISNNYDQLSLLKLFTDLGIAFNYGDIANPHNTNILKPSWVTKGIYEIINNNILFKQQGKATFEQIETILEAGGDYKDKANVIIGLMMQFGLCFPIQSNYYLIPDLLHEIQPPIDKSFEDGLQLYYQYSFLPSSLMPRFITKVHQLLKGKKYLWKSGVIIDTELNEALIKVDKRAKLLFISVIGELATRRDLLDEIRFHLSTLNSEIKSNLPRMLVPTTGIPKKMISYKLLIQLERAGKEHIFVEDLGEILIKPLLNGIISENERILDSQVLIPPMYLERIKNEIEKRKKELIPLETHYRQIQLDAANRAKRFTQIYIFALILLFLAVSFTVYKKPWDFIEPYIFIGTLILPIISLILFRKRITPKELGELYLQRSRKRIAHKENFNLRVYSNKKERLTSLEEKLKDYVV